MIQRMLLFIAMVVCLSGLARAEDWPQWRGPERTGLSREKGLLDSWPAKGPKLLWTFREAGAGYSSMSVVGDRLYSMGAEGDKEYIFAADLKTRKKLWATEVGTPYKTGYINGPSCTPTVDGDFLYALSGRGNLVCLEASNGRKVWSQGLVTDLLGVQPADSFTESPLVDGDLVLATPGGEDGTIAALDKKTGTLKWRSPPYAGNDSTNASMIAVKAGNVCQYVQMTMSFVAGVRAIDGKLLWKFTSGGIGYNTPIYHNGCVYAPVGYTSAGCCRLLKLISEGDQFKAQQLYCQKGLRNHFSGVLLVDEHIYGYSDSGQQVGWICQDFKTGAIVWKKNPHLGGGSVIYADSHLYCYHEDRGDVLLLKATPGGYQEKGRFRIPEETKLPRRGRIWSSPVVANGKLYLRDNDLIFCYDIRKPPQ